MLNKTTIWRKFQKHSPKLLKFTMSEDVGPFWMNREVILMKNGEHSLTKPAAVKENTQSSIITVRI